ncbi:MAG: hypothetical protein ACYDA9_01105 [Terriglobia bacterium]
MHHPPDQQGLKTLLESATKHATEVNQRAAQASLDIAKEKTQYFEKIALACAGTIALVVSFVGSHAGRLQPIWLLRSALAVLLLAMVVAMYRNWKYPFYLLASYAQEKFIAEQEMQRRKRDFIIAVPSLIVEEDGKPIDVQELLIQFNERDKLFDIRIAESKAQEDATFDEVKRVEGAALALTVAGMVLLIALAWNNF